MRYKVSCGLLDWRVVVEAHSPTEAIRRAKAEIMERLEQCDTYFAREIPSQPQTEERK